jgi:hypothetical protein
MMSPSSLSALEAPAGVLAILVAANGRVDEPELRVLDKLDAFRQIGVSRARFIELSQARLRDFGASLCEHAWLSEADARYLDGLLDSIADPQQRLLVCRLATAIVNADGQVTPDEEMVCNHVHARWHVVRTADAPDPLNDPVR